MILPLLCVYVCAKDEERRQDDKRWAMKRWNSNHLQLHRIISSVYRYKYYFILSLFAHRAPNTNNNKQRKEQQDC